MAGTRPLRAQLGPSSSDQEKAMAVSIFWCFVSCGERSGQEKQTEHSSCITRAIARVVLPSDCVMVSPTPPPPLLGIRPVILTKEGIKEPLN